MNDQYCQNFACFADKHAEGVTVFAVFMLFVIALVLIVCFGFRNDKVE